MSIDFLGKDILMCHFVFIRLLLILTICFSSYSFASDVDYKKSLEQFKKNEEVVLDVREFGELTSGYVDGALWVPFSTFGKSTDREKAIMSQLDKDKIVVVYCAVGGRASKIVSMLRAQGYKAVNGGGFSDMKTADFPVAIPAANQSQQCPWLCKSSKAMMSK